MILRSQRLQSSAFSCCKIIILFRKSLRLGKVTLLGYNIYIYLLVLPLAVILCAYIMNITTVELLRCVCLLSKGSLDFT